MKARTTHLVLRPLTLVCSTIAALAVCGASAECRAQSASYLCAKGDAIVVRSKCSSGERAITSLTALSKKAQSTTLASGKTVSGIFGIFMQSSVLDDFDYSEASFPLKAPVNVSDSDVIVKIDENSDNDCEGQVCGESLYDSRSDLCRGSSAAPTAPKGKLCIYIDYASNVKARSVGAVMIGGRDPATGDHFSRQGFQVYALTGSGGPGINLNGTWAYTAP